MNLFSVLRSFPFLGLSIVLIGLCASSCETPSKIAAHEHITKLPESVLLVRLNTYEDKIEYFKERGEVAKAKEVAMKVKFSNKAFIRSFKNDFDFCPVYFFLANKAKQVSKGNFEKVFVDENLEVISANDFPKDKVRYIAGLSGVEVDTEFNPIHDKLVLMDDRFKPLKAPFPFYHGYYYTRKPSQRVFSNIKRELKGKTKEAKMVYMLQKGLKRYHKKVGKI